MCALQLKRASGKGAGARMVGGTSRAAALQLGVPIIGVDALTASTCCVASTLCACWPPPALLQLYSHTLKPLLDVVLFTRSLAHTGMGYSSQVGARGCLPLSQAPAGGRQASLQHRVRRL